MPGLRRLLVEAEWRAEQALHVGRGLLALVLAAIIVFVWNGDGLPLPLVAATCGVALIVWGAVAWLLDRAPPQPWLPWALVVLDAVLLWRLTVLVRLHAVAPDGAVRPVAMAGELSDLMPLLFLLLALSGAARFDPRLALFTTALALLGLVAADRALGQMARATIPQGIVIAASGLLGAGAAQMLRRVVLKAQEEAILEHYVPEPLIHELVLAQEPRGQQSRLHPVTLLITDIRGFTTLSEPLSPLEAVELLNEYFAAVLVPLTQHGGYLDKYLGDGLLAFFETTDPQAPPDHAARALRAAQGILAAVDEFNRLRPDRPPLRIGVAVHTGEALVGSVGAPDRLNYTAIGDAVNVTARLEELNKHFPSVLVVSAAAVEAAADAVPAGLVGPVAMEIRGRHSTLDVYHLPAPGAVPTGADGAATREPRAADERAAGAP